MLKYVKSVMNKMEMQPLFPVDITLHVSNVLKDVNAVQFAGFRLMISSKYISTEKELRQIISIEDKQ